jgi:ubiquinone/menaquinone biosynthesis C-methylase UbiE
VNLTEEIRQAYDSSGEAWNDGPAAVYRALADPVLAAAGDVRGSRVLDVGTGSGALADELVRRGAAVLAVDLSLSMLRRGARERPPAAVADVRALPVPSGSVDLVTASFVLNHLDVPADGVRECARTLRAGGRLLATTFDGEARHPAKPVLDEVAVRHGFVPPQWYASVKEHLLPLLSSAERFEDAARAAGLAAMTVRRVLVALDLTTPQLVAWRLGMAHLAPFVAALDPGRRAALVAEAESAVAAMADPVQMAVLLLDARV